MEGLLTTNFVEMQECYTICLAACNELMSFALKENPWHEYPSEFDETKEIQRAFKVPSSPGMQMEYSIASGVVPIRVAGFISIMSNVKEWKDVFCDIIHCKTCEVSPGVRRGFMSTGPQPLIERTINSVRVINAELLYPMPYALPRKFSFIRFVKEVVPDVFAVVDVSTDYFPHLHSTWNANCKRRPSGVIVRKHGEDCSWATWIENMDVPRCNVENSIYSGVKMNLAFDAKRWMSMVSNHENRIRSKVVTCRLPTSGDDNVRKSMLALGKKLRTAFMSYIAEYRNEGDKPGWDIPEDGKCNIWVGTTAQGNKRLTALTTIRVKATPCAVFTFLVERTPQLQWPSLVEMAEPEEVVNLLSDDDSTCVLHAKRIKQTDSSEPQAKKMKQTGSGEQQATHMEFLQDCEYVLQEASPDDYCSLVLSSTPVYVQKFNSALQFKEDSYSLRPFGFSIVPNGSGGLLSDASIITMASQKEFDANVETSEAAEGMRQYAIGVINVIRKAFTAGDDVTEP